MHVLRTFGFHRIGFDFHTNRASFTKFLRSLNQSLFNSFESFFVDVRQRRYCATWHQSVNTQKTTQIYFYTCKIHSVSQSNRITAKRQGLFFQIARNRLQILFLAEPTSGTSQLLFFIQSWNRAWRYALTWGLRHGKLLKLNHHGHKHERRLKARQPHGNRGSREYIRCL